MPMTYGEALSYIDGFADPTRRVGRHYALDPGKLARVATILGALNHPERCYQTILIAGTKGKGSTAAFAEAALRSCGLKTGLYSSPHLNNVRERMRVEGNLISEHDFAELVEKRVQPILRRLERTSWNGLPPTNFELLAILGLLYFAESDTDVAVLEIGMGGRMDAMNVVSPLVSVITPISFDHMNILGSTLEEIAFEKAGIIRPGGTAVSAVQDFRAASTINKIAHQRRAKLHYWPDVVTPEPADGKLLYDEAHVPMGRTFDLVPQNTSLSSSLPTDKIRVKIPLLGSHQVHNACLAAAALLLWQDLNQSLRKFRHINVTSGVTTGFANVKWPGRLEIVSRDPVIIVDGAHNGESAQRLRQALETDFRITGQKVVYVYGASADKDSQAITRELAPLAASVVVTPLQNRRSARIEDIGHCWRELGVRTIDAADAGNALNLAIDLQHHSAATVICVTGSLYLVGEARDIIFGRKIESSQD